MCPTRRRASLALRFRRRCRERSIIRELRRNWRRTDPHYAKAQRQVLNFLLQDYIPDLLATGTVPPPPPEDPEKVWRRRVES
jgi:hypothetical protein